MRISTLIDGLTQCKVTKTLAVKYPTITTVSAAELKAVAPGTSALGWGNAFRDRSPAYFAALPVAILLAGAFPILASAREPAPARLESPDNGVTSIEAAPPPLRVAQASSEPPDKVRSFDIAPQDLHAALLEFATRTGIQFLYDAGRLKGRRTEGVRGTYTPEQALGRLLAGTTLTYRFIKPTAVTLEPAADQAADSSQGRFQIDPTTVEASKEEEQGFKAETQSSATKSPLSIRETPQSISVITQDLLDARQVTNLKQALETSAGVNQYSGTGPFAGTNAFGFQAFQIRGITTYGQFELREDGFLGSSYYAQPDLAVYERIEVVKGPASVLNGRSTAGGFINRIRKTPLPEAQAEFALSLGSFGLYRGDVDVTGPLFKSDKVRGRLVTAYEDADSFVDGVESQLAVVAPSLEVDITDSTRLRVQGIYQDQRFIPNSGFPLIRDGDIFRAPNVRRSLFFGVPNKDKDDNNWELLSGSAQLDQKLGDQWLATLRVNRTVTDQPIDLDSYAYVYDFEDFSKTGNIGLYSGAYDAENDVWSGDLRLVTGRLDLLGQPATLAFGADHSRSKVERLNDVEALGVANIYEQNFADFPTVQPTTPDSKTRDVGKNTGVYAELSLRPFERLNILLGGRYDWADSSSVADLLTNTPKTSQKDEDFTYRAGLVFDVLDNIAVYALYAQSFVPQLSRGENGEPLNPETGEIYEGGIKAEWFDGKLGANAAVFRLERDNVAIPALGVGNDFSIPAGLQRSAGAELEINGAPLPGWNLSLGASLLDAKFVEKGDPFRGSRPGGTADWQLGLYTSYELQSGLFKGLGLGASLFAIDERGVSEFVPDANLEGYERLDLNLFYNGFENFKIALQVRNVFDKTYVEGADRPGAYATFGSPTAVLLRLEGRLDDQLLGKAADTVADLSRRINDLFK